jgi:hypothetical protein
MDGVKEKTNGGDDECGETKQKGPVRCERA